MKFRQPAAALLSVALSLSLTVGCGEAADPLPDVHAHALKGGFRDTNPAYPSRLGLDLTQVWALKHGKTRS